MNNLLAVFLHVMAPLSFVVGIGYVAGRALSLDPRTLSRLGLYVLIPCMAFAAMARTTLSAGELGRIAAFFLILILMLYPISAAAARLLRLGAAATASFHLGVLFGNVVNVGFPVLLLGYGEPAIERGVVIAITMQIALQSLGVYLAARGRRSISQAIASIWKLPGIYAVLVGLALNVGRVDIPALVYNPLKMLGDSVVPVLMLLLGMQLARARFRGHWKTAVTAATLRLGAAAGMAFLLADWFGLEGLTRQTVIVESAMPTAIFGVVLAEEFDAAPDLITVLVSVSTLASIVTLAVLLAVV